LDILGGVESTVLLLVLVESCRTDLDGGGISRTALLSVSELLGATGKGAFIISVSVVFGTVSVDEPLISFK